MEPLTAQEALEYCLQNPDNLTNEQLLAKFPQYAQELTQLLALDRQLKDVLPGATPATGLDKVKARVLSSLAQPHKDTTSEAEIVADEAGVDSLLSQADKRTIKPIIPTPEVPDPDGAG